MTVGGTVGYAGYLGVGVAAAAGGAAGAVAAGIVGATSLVGASVLAAGGAWESNHGIHELTDAVSHYGRCR